MQEHKKSYITHDIKIPEIISGNPFLILMLEHLEIGLGLQEKTISDLCKENNIDEGLFLTMINLYAGNTPSETVSYSPGVIGKIILYLRNSHQYYLEEKYPLIKSYIEEINSLNNGSREIKMIGMFFENYFREVSEHLDYENSIVFPYVTSLNDILNGKEDFKAGNYSVKDYLEHHNDIEEKLEDLYNLLIRYIPQKNDGRLRRKLLFALFELEYDLKIHSMIEEKILIPLVEEMEFIRNSSL
ncbi:MAG TPA: hypothetical protein VHO46_05955 [Bacteroidales bacterium]|nr:hypothetical protein [Bacteroidales bacterium]